VTLISITICVDELALIGHSFDDLDLVIVALNGLGYTYHEFCAAIRTRDTLLLFDELFDKLVGYEIFLQRRSSNPSSSHPHNSFSSSYLICQYCDHRGHTAKTCYKLHGYPSKHSRRQANTVNKDSGSKRFWLLDSGASHHVIGDLANLTLAHDYPVMINL